MVRNIKTPAQSGAGHAGLPLNMFLRSCHGLKNTLKALGVNLIWCLSLLLTDMREFLCPSLPDLLLSPEQEGAGGGRAVPAKPLSVVEWERKSV